MSFTFVIVSRATLLRSLLRDKIQATLHACCLADCASVDDLPADLDVIDLAIVDADDLGPHVFSSLHSLIPARRIRHGCLLSSTRGSFLAHCLGASDKFRGLIHQGDTLEAALCAIGDLARGAVRVSSLVDQTERRHFSVLISPREAELAESFAYGVKIEVVAARFGLSPETVRTHRRNLLLKADAHSQTDFIRFALGSGLIAPRDFILNRPYLAAPRG